MTGNKVLTNGDVMTGTGYRVRFSSLSGRRYSFGEQNFAQSICACLPIRIYCNLRKHGLGPDCLFKVTVRPDCLFSGRGDVFIGTLLYISPCET